MIYLRECMNHRFEFKKKNKVAIFLFCPFHYSTVCYDYGAMNFVNGLGSCKCIFMTRQVHNMNIWLLKMILYRSIRDQGMEDFILLCKSAYASVICRKQHCLGEMIYL